jgi:hypothetical protein
MFFTFCGSAMPLDLKKVNAPSSKRICGGRYLIRTDALVTGVGGVSGQVWQGSEVSSAFSVVVLKSEDSSECLHRDCLVKLLRQKVPRCDWFEGCLSTPRHG